MKIDKAKKIELYQSLFKIRQVETRLNDLFAKNLFPGYIHSYMGEEACAVGVCAALTQADYIISNHRARGHLIAKGIALNPMMAEMLGKSTGTCGGRGGEMHVADLSLGILGGNGIVGGGIPYSLGSAYSAVLRGTDQVTAVFFGDGASNEGSFHEALNLAAAWKLPILFVVENNLYMEMTPIKDVMNVEDIAERAKGYGIPGVIVDGNDVLAVLDASQKAVALAREGKGPTLLELKTYRWGGHFQGDPCNYRTREEEAKWKARCPVKLFKAHLIDKKVATVKEIEKLEAAIVQEVEESVTFALESPLPDPAVALNAVYAD